jgi:hypothetical protein
MTKLTNGSHEVIRRQKNYISIFLQQGTSYIFLSLLPLFMRAAVKDAVNKPYWLISLLIQSNPTSRLELETK